VILSLWRAADGERPSERLFHWPAGDESLPFMVQKEWPEDWLGELAAGRQIFENRAESLKGLFSSEILSLTLIPLMVGGRFWGFMTMPKRTKEPYTEEETSIVTAGGILVVSAILEKEMTDSLVSAKDAALKATQVKSDFLSRMSHEMRTPMNAIIGMTRIARGTEDQEKLDFCLSTIDTSSSHLLNLINDVLDMSKIEAGKLELDSAPFDMEKMLMKACSVIEESVEQKNQRLHVVMGKDMHMNYIGDEMRLSQVLINLFSNAAKFTPENGKILLRVEETERGENNSKLRFTVTDTGIGISREQAGQIFNSFQQADASIAKRYGGTGLGLAISKKIVEQMNGRIEVFSEFGQGASFVFDVELARASQEEEKEENPGASSLQGVRALIAGAEPETLEQIRNVTDRAGISPDIAPDGASAVSLVNAAARSGKPYGLIFWDLGLPNGSDDGIADDGIANDEIAAISSFDSAADRDAVVLMTPLLKWNRIEERAKQAGIHRFLTKPLFPSSIRDVLSVLRGKDEPDAGGESAAQIPDLSGRRMLLVDDVELNRIVLMELLSDTNIEIDEAADGETALSLFENSPEHRYDIVFMDIQMPGMDGYETTGHIRKLERADAKTVNIIALTAAAYKEDVEKAIQAGMNGHLSKPVDIDEVQKLLEDLLIKKARP
jgi:signal transduction histidine kinase/CheY-like chemotaxis protein